MAQPFDRSATDPGGCECTTCGVIFVGAACHTECAVCSSPRGELHLDHAVAEGEIISVPWPQDLPKS
jgi:hypothetical protein